MASFLFVSRSIPHVSWVKGRIQLGVIKGARNSFGHTRNKLESVTRRQLEPLFITSNLNPRHDEDRDG